MENSPRRRYLLEVEPAAEPIDGVLQDEDGRRRPFHGWLGFAAALQALSRRGDDDEDERP